MASSTTHRFASPHAARVPRHGSAAQARRAHGAAETNRSQRLPRPDSGSSPLVLRAWTYPSGPTPGHLEACARGPRTPGTNVLEYAGSVPRGTEPHGTTTRAASTRTRTQSVSSRAGVAMESRRLGDLSQRRTRDWAVPPRAARSEPNHPRRRRRDAAPSCQSPGSRPPARVLARRRHSQREHGTRDCPAPARCPRSFGTVDNHGARGLGRGTPSCWSLRPSSSDEARDTSRVAADGPLRRALRPAIQRRFGWCCRQVERPGGSRLSACAGASWPSSHPPAAGRVSTRPGRKSSAGVSDDASGGRGRSSTRELGRQEREPMRAVGATWCA